MEVGTREGGACLRVSSVFGGPPLSSIITAINIIIYIKGKIKQKKSRACCFVVLFNLFEFLDPMRIRENKSM